MGVPESSSILMGVSRINHPAIGVPPFMMFMETPFGTPFLGPCYMRPSSRLAVRSSKLYTKPPGIDAGTPPRKPSPCDWNKKSWEITNETGIWPTRMCCFTGKVVIWSSKQLQIHRPINGDSTITTRIYVQYWECLYFGSHGTGNGKAPRQGRWKKP